jgi:hypothetical protein
VKPHNTSRAGSFVQAIDILGDERKVIKDTAPVSKDIVGAIGLTGGNLLTAPVVPLPDQHRVTRKRIRCRELFGSIRSPQALLTSKRWDSAGSGDACPRQYGYSLAVAEPRGQVMNTWVLRGVHDEFYLAPSRQRLTAEVAHPVGESRGR